MPSRNSELIVVIGVLAIITALGGGVLLASAIDRTVSTPDNGDTRVSASSTPVTATVPADVEAVEPLAVAFTERLRTSYPDATVYVTPRGTIVVELAVTGAGYEATESMRTVALTYSQTVAETGHDPVRLSVVTGGVEGIVTAPVVAEHAAGNLTDTALAETIEVREIGTANGTRD